MRQHRPAGEIADREYVRHVGLHLLVDGDDAAFVDVDARVFGAELVAIRPAADGHQHFVEGVAGRLLPFLEQHVDARGRRLHGRDFRTEHDVVFARLDDLEERPQQVRVGAGHQRIHQLDDGDRRTERAVDAGHLQADDAATDDKQLPGYRIELQRAG